MREDLRTLYGDERLPRYTSYPASPHFGPQVDAGIYADWLGALPAGTTASLYLHVPFCRSMCWYCGCHTSITRHDAPIADYLSTLRAEIGIVARQLDRSQRVRHVHFGGGTPTIVAPDAFRDLLGLLRDTFRLDPDAEVAVEIDPRTLTPEMTLALGKAGVTRASLGVQSFDPAVQQAIRRRQGYDVTEASVAGLRAAGVRGINLDLIYGLPHQTVASCVETVRQCLGLRPDRLAVFGYAHVPSFKKHQRHIDEATMPDGAARQAQAEAIAGALAEAGYVRIGLDHYALPADPMAVANAAGTLRRNFQGYTTDPAEVLIGFGASSIGRLPQGYVQNEPALRAYAERVARGGLATVKGYALTPDDRLRADLIERIMCDFAVDVGAVCRAHGRNPDAILAATPRLAILAGHGLVRRDGRVLSIPDGARAFVRNVAAAFDAHLGTSAAVHSRAA
ncbi:oxygen-independent coproporphyrinogen III oxidase [Methylobacterium dankookense]|jgi:oxygen-independent coproporphyrinogen-3 oxidase|uniref:Coproporphyrinogen-III oxidase n=1 Tax=Methylobacterium dankookense TaxID=560405 RepID=A0A564G191_9HYPH|nr:oxygen-independent coproporphyrinogen III oxidase [Methylobacterium dankookense]GJD57692.1 Oxygen-independent coproporphyrinogen III oxidase [Methylobacterium dankookense]VUF13786.1 Oxygen-independent coproporphyrinogen III oxidase [Methylobacterium dankookense]